jgi:hypothetical protein
MLTTAILGAFAKPPPEPLREGALASAPIAVQTTGRTLYKQLLALVQTQLFHQSTPVQ